MLVEEKKLGWKYIRKGVVLSTWVKPIYELGRGKCREESKNLTHFVMMEREFAFRTTPAETVDVLSENRDLMVYRPHRREIIILSMT